LTGRSTDCNATNHKARDENCTMRRSKGRPAGTKSRIKDRHDQNYEAHSTDTDYQQIEGWKNEQRDRPAACRWPMQGAAISKEAYD
jgi:hypothetical protein